MLQEIRKKMVILKNHMPFSPDMKDYFRHVEEREWLISNMRIEGSALTESQIDMMAQGRICNEVSIGEHVAVRKIADLPDKLWQAAEMKRDLELNLIKEISLYLTQQDGSAKEKLDYGYRKRNIIIQELSYTPPLPAEIPEQMDRLAGILIEAAGTDPQSEEFFRKGALIHNMIATIVPYGQRDRLTARAAVSYLMISKGYPLVTFDMQEQDYNMMIERFIRTGRPDECAEELKKALLKRLRLMTQLTRY